MGQIQLGGRVHDFVADFGLFRLHQTLVELGCDVTTQNRLIEWYWKNATWFADNQSEFDAIARGELLTQINGSSSKIDGLASLQKFINDGAKRTIPAHLRSRKFLGYTSTGREAYAETQLEDDASQDAWVNLIERGTVDGMSSGREITREGREFRPLPEVEYCDPGADYAPDVWRLIRDADDGVRRRILADFKAERPEDYAFLVEYIGNRYRRRVSKKTANRAGTVVALLRRRYFSASENN